MQHTPLATELTRRRGRKRLGDAADLRADGVRGRRRVDARELCVEHRVARALPLVGPRRARDRLRKAIG
jgi:hypothetical protein